MNDLRNRWLWLLLSSALSAEAEEISVSAGLDYSEGRYGGGQSTQIRYAALAAKYATGANTFRLTLPYLSIRSPAGGNLIGVDAQGLPVYDGSGPKQTEEGIGDVVAAYSRALFEQPRNGFLLDLGGKVKFASADASRGLGTGENDYTLLADLYYLADAWTPFATLSYRISGDPAGSDLNNVRGFTLGLGYRHSARDSLGLIWDGREAATAGSADSREATLYWVHRLDEGVKFQAYAVKGFSDASVDWALGVQLDRSFGK